MRKGFDGLAALVQDHLRQNPFSGQAFVFRGSAGSSRQGAMVGWARGMPIDSAAPPDDVDAPKRIIGEMARDAPLQGLDPTCLSCGPRVPRLVSLPLGAP
jgi:hypothetical protein